MVTLIQLNNSVQDFLSQCAEGKKAFNDIQLGRAILTGAALNRLQLEKANLHGADLSFSCLDGANLSGADLGGANLTGASLKGAKLTGAHLTFTCLKSANLSGAFLTKANLKGANLDGADLKGVHLNEAVCDGASFEGAALTHAFLVKTSLLRANLEETDLRGSWLTGSLLKGARLNRAYYSAQTHFDLDFDPRKEGMIQVLLSSIQDVVNVCNGITAYSYQHLSREIVQKYWLSSRPSSAWAYGLGFDHRGLFAAAENEEMTLSASNEAQEWIKRYLALCSAQIPDFAQFLN